MFDVGFSELMVIAVVALIVIGPEKLPGVARTAGHLLGRLQRYVNDVKADINREMQLDELKKLQEQVAEEARSMESSVQAQLNSVETSLNESIAGPQETPATGIGDSPAAEPAALPESPMPDAYAAQTGTGAISAPPTADGQAAVTAKS